MRRYRKYLQRQDLKEERKDVRRWLKHGQD